MVGDRQSQLRRADSDPATSTEKLVLSVLVVDDEEQLAQITRRVVEGRGHMCMTAGSVREARALLATHLFELVVLDWNLPDGTGLDLCSEIRRMRGHDMPFIFMVTGRQGEDNVALAIEAGVDDHMRKPLDVDQLSNRIHVAERQIKANLRRQRAEDKLLATTRRFSQLMQDLPEAVIVVRDLRCVYVNPAASNLLGYDSPFELMNLAWDEAIHPGDQTALLERMRAIVVDGALPEPRVARVRRKSGEWLECEFRSLAIEYEGQPAILSIARDVQVQQRTQQELLQADRMVSLGTLAAGVAHEINNPLAYVIANLQHLVENLPKVGGDPDTPRLVQEMHALAVEAKEGAERMRVIVRDLGTFSRATDESRQSLDIARVLDSCVNIAWNEIRHRGTLVREYGETPVVGASEARLGQVFLNLLVNAAHALPEVTSTGKITLRTYTDRLGNAVIDVIDNGHGIAKEHLKRIFDPFFTTKPKGVGTGLGLAISQSILSSMGGGIEVFSEQGKGTTFRVTLPSEQTRPASVRSSPRPMSGDVKHAKVLVIDDEAAVGRALGRLIGTDHKVTLLTSGTDAVKHLLEGADYDMIFCDVMMPDVGGIEVYEAIGKARPELLSRIVFMTGGVFSDRAREFFGQNEIRFLDKPFDVAQVREMLDSRPTDAPKPG
ncbi:MAG: response regulator [Sandaracinaceae bacterium]|nr:response regulator [Sandaracinaceae bacterium]